uniref:Uncharacterized protein n=1 Tax=Tetranychus urticae TaxID=32264 RepID=T1KAT1_TETUR
MHILMRIMIMMETVALWFSKINKDEKETAAQSNDITKG